LLKFSRVDLAKKNCEVGRWTWWSTHRYCLLACCTTWWRALGKFLLLVYITMAGR